MRGGGPAFAARPRDDPATGGRKVRDGKPLEPLPSGPGKGSGKLEPFVAFCAELAELIEQDPDIPLVALQAALPAADGVPCSTSGTDALLRRHGYTYIAQRHLCYTICYDISCTFGRHVLSLR